MPAIIRITLLAVELFQGCSKIYSRYLSIFSLELMIMKIFIFISLYLSASFLQAQDVMEFTAIEKSSYAAISKRVLNVAYDRLGIEMVAVDLPAERAIYGANAGEADGELYRIKNIHLKYKNLIMVPVPIGMMEGIAITTQKDLSIDTWEELSPHRTCIRNGVKFAEAGTREFDVITVNSNKQLFGMLGKNRCDVIIIARITSIPLVSDFIKKENGQTYQSTLQTYPLFHYLHKKNADLVPKLVKVLTEMEEEGLIEEIRSQYIAEISKAK